MTTTEPDTRAEGWALVTAAQAGDRDAFAQLWHQHRSSIRLLIFKYVRSWDVADDLTSETCVRAWLRIHTLCDQGKPPIAWLNTIARNVALDWLKASARRCGLIDDVNADIWHAWPTMWATRPADVPAQVARNEAAALLARYVAQLNPQHQRVLHLRFAKQLPIGEVAAQLGINEGACKALQHRAVLRLRQLMTGAGYTSADLLGAA